MAFRPCKQILILKRLLVPTIAAIVAFTATEAAFYYFERSQQKAVWQSVTALLRNEADLANSYQLSRTLRDMEVANWINCVVLKETTPSERYFYDSSHRDGCENSSGLLSGKLASLNNNQWHLEFKAKKDAWLVFSHNILRVILLGLFLGLVYYYQRKNRQEETRALRVEFERQWLMDLASQTQHDIASPISALRAIAKSKQLPESLKKFLDLTIERTETVFLDLQKAKNPEQASPLEKIDIAKIVGQIVNEKRETQKVPINFETINQAPEISGVRSDFFRIVSNLLNNASESFPNQLDPKAKITVSLDNIQGVAAIKIRDNGNGMSPDVLSKIGTKGYTYGKPAGSGLGYWHAQSTVKSWGGELSIKSKEGVGTEVSLMFSQSSRKDAGTFIS